jgi:hypothetical protein
MNLGSGPECRHDRSTEAKARPDDDANETARCDTCRRFHGGTALGCFGRGRKHDTLLPRLSSSRFSSSERALPRESPSRLL